jgi:hypothetical protein
MFPGLTPGLVLSELELEVSRSPDWDAVLKAAQDHAQRYEPDFVERLDQLTAEEASASEES